MTTTIQNAVSRGTMEQLLLDYFVERRRALLAELKSVDAQLVILRANTSTNADRKQQRAHEYS